MQGSDGGVGPITSSTSCCCSLSQARVSELLRSGASLIQVWNLFTPGVNIKPAPEALSDEPLTFSWMFKHFHDRSWSNKSSFLVFVGGRSWLKSVYVDKREGFLLRFHRKCQDDGDEAEKWPEKTEETLLSERRCATTNDRSGEIWMNLVVDRNRADEYFELWWTFAHFPDMSWTFPGAGVNGSVKTHLMGWKPFKSPLSASAAGNRWHHFSTSLVCPHVYRCATK